MSQHEVWAPNGEPFCFQPKAARREIRDSLDGENTVATGLGVYDALTEVASDEQSAVFQTTYAYLSLKSGLSPRTVQARVKDLDALGLVEYSTPKLKAPGTFRLVCVKQPLPNDTQPLPNDRQPLKQATLPRSEESKKNLSKESHEDVGAKASRPASKTPEQLIAELKTSPAYTGIDVPREYARMLEWCARNHKQPTERRFINWLNRCDRPLTGQSPTPTAPPAKPELTLRDFA